MPTQGAIRTDDIVLRAKTTEAVADLVRHDRAVSLIKMWLWKRRLQQYLWSNGTQKREFIHFL